MKVAENITVDAKGLLIDGRRLPYMLAIRPVQAKIVERTDGCCEVTFTLLTDSVSATPEVEVTPDGDVILIEEEAQSEGYDYTRLDVY